MCIYGMDSPGGYQLIRRTLPSWENFHQNKSFKDYKPWLLRFFDQIRFYPVTEDQLLILREDIQKGSFQLNIIEENYFHLSDYERFLQENCQSIDLFRHHQSLAFNQEVSLWKNNIIKIPNNTINKQNFLFIFFKNKMMDKDSFIHIFVEVFGKFLFKLINLYMLILLFSFSKQWKWKLFLLIHSKKPFHPFFVTRDNLFIQNIFYSRSNLLNENLLFSYSNNKISFYNLHLILIEQNNAILFFAYFSLS